MAESRDFDESGAIAVSLSTTDLSGTGLAKEATTSKDTSVQGISGQGGWPTSGLAKETGGNLQTARTMLDGTAAGALLGVAGNTLGKEIAAWLAGGSVTATPGGTPLLHGYNHVFGVSNQVIAAGGSFTPANITFAKPGYYIRFTLNGGAGTAATPYAKFDLEWQVAAQGNLDSYEEIWYANIGTSSNHRTNGRGPTHGDTLKLTITNGDVVKSVTLGMDIWETTHTPAKSDWRDNSGVSSGQGSTQPAQALANLLMDQNVSVPASSSKITNLPLYAGQVNVSVSQNNHAGANITINPIGAFDLVNQNPVVTIDWTLAASNYPSVTLPRCPCEFIANNTNTVAVGLLGSISILERST